MKIENINEKELFVVKTKVIRALSSAMQFEIIDDNSMLKAGELRKEIKEVGKVIKSKKEEITKPLNEALKNIRALFSEIENSYEKAEEVVSDKMLSYQRFVEEERAKIEREAQRKIEEAQRKLEEGKITEKQAERIEIRNEEKIELAPEVIKRSEDFHTRTVKKFKIVNENEIPREYFVVDEVKIRKAMMAGIAIKGVEYYEEKILV